MWPYNRLKTIIILGPMLMSFALAMDVYMPALTDIRKDFGTTPVMLQFTLSLFVVLSGVGQLVLGPLSDAMGRYKIMFFSSLIFFIFSVLCATSTTISQLIIYRIFQAIGCCGMSVVTFAIVRDAFHGRDSSLIYTFFNATISISPILGPLIGVGIIYFYTWQFTFFFLGIISLVDLFAIIFFVKESLSVENRQKMTWSIVTNYWHVIKSFHFWAYTVAAGAGFIAFFTLFSMTPYIVDTLGKPKSTISLMFGIAGCSFLLGCLFSGYVSQKVGVLKGTMLGAGIIILAGIIEIIVYLNAGLSLWGFFVPCYLATFGAGHTSGNGASGALEPFGEFAGTASAMFGAMQFSIAAIGASLAMLLDLTSSIPMGLALLLGGIPALVMLVILLMKRDKNMPYKENS